MLILMFLVLGDPGGIYTCEYDYLQICAGGCTCVQRPEVGIGHLFLVALHLHFLI